MRRLIVLAAFVTECWAQPSQVVIVPGSPPGGAGAACTDHTHGYLATTGVIYTCQSSTWQSQGGGGGGATCGTPDCTVGGNLSVGGTATVGATALSKNSLLSGQLPDIDSSGYVPALAGAGAGNVDNGIHHYKFTQTDVYGETAAGAATPAVTVVDKTSNGKVNVSIPILCNVASPNLNIYRDANDGVYKLVEAINFPCAINYVDNIANASLGVVAPTGNTTAGFGIGVVGTSLTALISTDDWCANCSFVTLGNGQGGAWWFNGSHGLPSHPNGGQVFYEGGDAWGDGVGGDSHIFGGQSYGAGRGGNVQLQVGSNNGGSSTEGTIRMQNGDGDDMMTIHSGNVTIPSLAGTGNAFACLDSTGKIYRSATACTP